MSKLLVSKKQIPWPKRRYLLGVSIGRAGQVCAKPAIDPLRGSGFAGRFAIEWHRFQVKLKPDRDHWNLPNQAENLVYLCRIWLFWSSKSTKSSWKLVGKLKNTPKFDVFRQVGFHGFWRRGLETDPHALGFGAQDPRPTAGAVKSGEHGSGTGGLDSPNIYNGS